MNIEVKKLARDPLVWVGAALLCVPLLAAGSLNHLRAYLTYDREPSVIERSVSQEFAEDIPVVGESFSREPLPSQSRRLPPIALAENGGVEVAELNAPVQEPVSLPPATSEIAMSEIVMPEIAMADPGSLLELAAEFDQEHNGKKDSSKNETQTGPDTKAEQEEDDFDFLFGDDAATEEKSKDVAKDTKKEPSTSETDNKVAKESKSSEPKSVEDKPSETEQESALLSKTDKSSSDGESGDGEPVDEPSDDASFEPPMMADLDDSGFKPTSPMDSGFNDGSESQVQIWGQPMVSPQLVEPDPIQMHQLQSDYYVELQSGPDWWTPYCHQQFWSDIPVQQSGLDAIVFAAMQNSPYVKLLNTEPQIAQTTILEADGLFDWSAFVESSWNDTDRAVVSLLDTGTAGGRFVQQQLLFEAGVQKSLRTGGHLRVGHAWQRTDNNSSFLSPADQATAQILLDYRQPLMRGAGKHVNSSQVMLAQLSFESSQNNSQAQLQQFLVDVVSEYWELHFARGVLMQKLRSVERAEQLMSELASRDDAGSRRRDLARIQAIATARRTDLIRAENAVASRQETLLNLTYGTAMPDPTSLELVPVESPGTFMVPYNLGFVTEMAVQNRAEVKVALTAIRASAVRQNLVLNELKPRLDAIVSTFLSGVDSYKDVGGAFSDSLNYNPSYAVGVSFEMPLGRRTANARMTRQNLEYQRLQYQLEQTLGNVRLDARLAWRNVSSIASELENHKLAVEHANKELHLATKQAANGVSESAENTSFLIDDLLRSQEGVAVAESRLLRSQTDLSVALVQLKRATGQLLQTAPMPQVSNYTVQQAGYEEAVDPNSAGPSQQEGPRQVLDSMWKAPDTHANQ